MSASARRLRVAADRGDVSVVEAELLAGTDVNSHGEVRAPRARRYRTIIRFYENPSRYA